MALGGAGIASLFGAAVGLEVVDFSGQQRSELIIVSAPLTETVQPHNGTPRVSEINGLMSSTGRNLANTSRKLGLVGWWLICSIS